MRSFIDLPISLREARGLRGRHGVDVWEWFVNTGPDVRRNFLIKRGVPESRLTATLADLLVLLWDEDIRQSPCGYCGVPSGFHCQYPDECRDNL